MPGASSHVRRGLLLACLSLVFPAVPGAATVSSYAFVNDDASLRIRNRTIHLHGIHVPETARACTTSIRPIVCGSRARLALEFIIDGFVRCELLGSNSDGSFTGKCRVGVTAFEEGTDLAAYLLRRGWALALPEAPFAYHALEKIARSQAVGVWGLAVDRIGR